MVNKVVTSIYIFLIIAIVGFSFYKVNKRHEEKLYKVMYYKIEYAAKKCNLDNVCGNDIVLKDLYDNNYLQTLYDPISKEEVNIQKKITIKNDSVNVER